MTQHDSEISPPSDVCLLLRADAEQRWLSVELAPILRELQRRELPEEQLGAALAYLEVLWLDATQRAAETEAAYAQLEAGERVLLGRARRYYAAVRSMREALGRQVAKLLAIPGNGRAQEHAGR